MRSAVLPCIVPLALAACVHSRVAGSSTAEMIPREVAAEAPAPGNIELVAPEPEVGNGLPTYPRRPLAAAYGAAAIVVRVGLDVEGRVMAIQDSPVAASDAGPYASDFRSAVEAVVWKWRFRPAERRVLAPALIGMGTAGQTTLPSSRAHSWRRALMCALCSKSSTARDKSGRSTDSPQ